MTTVKDFQENPEPTASEEAGWFQRLTRIGQEPLDPVELKKEKSLWVVGTLLNTWICAVWYIPLVIFGAMYAVVALLVYQLSTLVSVLSFVRSKSLKSFRSRQMLLMLIMPMGMHFGLGGFAFSGGVVLWSFLAPLSSLLFEGPRRSLRWFLVFCTGVILSGVVDSIGLLPVYVIPLWVVLFFYVMNFVCVAGIVYAGVCYFGDLLEKEKEAQLKRNGELKEASEHKSSFLVEMSDELRRSLNAIIGFTRIVKRRGSLVLPETQVENLDKVLSSAEHLLDLSNDILELARSEAGAVEVEGLSERGALHDRASLEL